MCISRLFGSDERTPDPERSVSSRSLASAFRSSVDPLAEMLVNGVFVPFVPGADPFSEAALLLLVALFFAA